jgi:hypothetical protein
MNGEIRYHKDKKQNYDLKILQKEKLLEKYY